MPRKRNTQSATPLVVSRRTAAELLGSSVDTVDRLIRQGRLKSVKVTARKPGIVMASIQAIVAGAE
jgi:excisionase family DNA binding protein